ncbi:MAG: cation:proton antiporter [Schleiferiaceae bacterium]|jgi:Kef-type K+ transport system membrane component KefB|nr:cation:proton antiporter [Schleiferiaceae bacterium]
MKKLYALIAFLGFSIFAFAEGDGGGHGDPYSSEFLAVFLVLSAAVIGRFIARKLNQSEVLGELIIGILIGALGYQLGNEVIVTIRHTNEINAVLSHLSDESISWDDNIKAQLMSLDLPEKVETKLNDLMTSGHFQNTFLNANYTMLFSSLGVTLLLFMVGLEVSIEEMINMGGSSIVVAVLGVVFPFALGYLGMHFFVPEGADDNIAIFVGATLAATSIGITARVFKDAHKIHLKEAKLVLGAAVIDDILGLILLAIVSGVVSSGSLEVSQLAIIIGKSLGFLVGVFFLEKYFLRRNIRTFSKVAGGNTLLLYPFALLMFLAWAADFIGLATIVGAFAAGLILKDDMFEGIKKEGQNLETILSPLEAVFAPVFFVLMGFQVDITTFAEWHVLSVGLGLTVVAAAGKILAGVFVKKGYNKLVIGIGLLPRGEVGLIFASIGKGLGVLDADLFSMIIIVVIATTLITPPLLNWALKKVDDTEESQQISQA